jgi:hypothetical protein
MLRNLNEFRPNTTHEKTAEYYGEASLDRDCRKQGIEVKTKDRF